MYPYVETSRCSINNVMIVYVFIILKSGYRQPLADGEAKIDLEQFNRNF